MLLPILSVTVIGLIIGVGVGVAGLRGSRGWPAIARGLIGGWAGFLAGALVGVAVDVVFHTGVWVAVAGHAGAVAGAFLAVTRFLRQSASTDSGSPAPRP